MSVVAIYRHLFGKPSEHKEPETQSECDQEKSTTDSDSAFETCGSLTFLQYALPSQAVEHAHESEGNRKERGQFHA
jgi:hypothetical protein